MRADVGSGGCACRIQCGSGTKWWRHWRRRWSLERPCWCPVPDPRPPSLYPKSSLALVWQPDVHNWSGLTHFLKNVLLADLHQLLEQQLLSKDHKSCLLGVSSAMLQSAISCFTAGFKDLRPLFLWRREQQSNHLLVLIVCLSFKWCGDCVILFYL